MSSSFWIQILQPKYFLQCAGKNVIVDFLPNLSPKTVSIVLENKVILILGIEQKIRSFGPLIQELWLFSVKEQNERVH